MSQADSPAGNVLQLVQIRFDDHMGYLQLRVQREDRLLEHRLVLVGYEPAAEGVQSGPDHLDQHVDHLAAVVAAHLDHRIAHHVLEG